MICNKKIIIYSLIAVLLGTVAYFSFNRLSSADCTSIEKFDSLTGTCYYNCTSDYDCANKAKKVDVELNSYFADAETKRSGQSNGQASPTMPTSKVEKKLLTKAFTGSETSGSVYTVNENLSLMPKPSTSDLRLWQLFSRIVGKDELAKYIQSFEVFDDSNSDSAASVWQSQSPGKWHVNVNAAYIEDKKDLIYTMVHEYGHIISLNSMQIDGNIQGSCPRLALSEGCAKQTSYINAYYNKFWRQYGSDAPADEGQNQNEVQKFFDQNRGSFVSEYAANNYTEDWAETWATFVTKAKTNGDQVKDKKVQTMYEYPALVRERDRIRVQIAASL